MWSVQHTLNAKAFNDINTLCPRRRGVTQEDDEHVSAQHQDVGRGEHSRRHVIVNTKLNEEHPQVHCSSNLDSSLQSNIQGMKHHQAKERGGGAANDARRDDLQCNLLRSA